jgi:6-phospho-beta-glucosidase
MKVAVIGGGSSYTPELINGFLERIESFPITELWLMDISQERLDIVGKFAQRMVAAKGSPFTVTLTRDQHAAIHGAKYVINQFRVGMMEARKGDEYLGRRHGLIGQETTGVGGMAKALRTIPVVLSIAEDMRHLGAPDALLVNFTNPSGLVAEALARYAPDVASVGVCNAPITTEMGLREELEKARGEKIDPARVHLEGLGLNHLSWYRSFSLDGVDIWPEIMKGYLAKIREDKDSLWDARTIEALGMIPNGYLQYYYYTDHKLAAQEKWPPSRAEAVMEIEKQLMQEYSEPDRTEPPADLMKRGGAYYSTVATQLLNAHYNNLGEIHTVNVRNSGAVSEWPEDWVLELPARVDSSGIHPLPTQPLPPVCFGLLSHVKMYELLTVEAAVHGDPKFVYQALLTHPLGPKADRIQAVLDDMLQTNQAWLPQFRSSGSAAGLYNGS